MKLKIYEKANERDVVILKLQRSRDGIELICCDESGYAIPGGHLLCIDENGKLSLTCNISPSIGLALDGMGKLMV